MYHNINDLCKKINVIKQKADELCLTLTRDLQEPLDNGLRDPQIQYQLDDIQALCADISNDKGHY